VIGWKIAKAMAAATIRTKDPPAALAHHGRLSPCASSAEP
jgi:hypothetical protein